MSIALLYWLFSQWGLYVVLFLLYLFLVFRWSTSPYNFFEKKGVVFKKPSPMTGNFGAMTFRKITIHDMVYDDYMEFKGQKFFGLFDFRRPLFVIRDLEIIKQITVKDFEHFLDHRDFFLDEETEPLLGKSLFMLKGQKWRDMRATLSPAFTGSKMRQMFQMAVECSEEATAIILKEANTADEPYVPEMKDIFTRFTNDVIASSAFGLKVNSLQNPENAFYKMAKRSTNFEGSFRIMYKWTVMAFFPTISKMLGFRFFEKDQFEFFSNLVHGTIKHREDNNIIRPDMIHLLMQARKGSLRSEAEPAETRETKGFATVEEISADRLKGGEKRQWSDDDLTAQCFLFLLAGFDTSATLLCFMAHELCENPDVQARLYDEIQEVRERLRGKPLTYDILQKMKYMDMITSETLRKWPPVVVIDRRCIKRYEINDDDGKKIVIDEGDAIWIPVYGIHRDPKYYANPDKFDPERFSDANKDNILPFSYLPFGSGPRNCIGSRFALMECKAFIFYLLSAFSFEVAATTTIPLVMAKAGFTIRAEGGFNIHMKPRVTAEN